MRKLNYSKDYISLHSGGFEVHILETVDSTNTYVRNRIDCLKDKSIVIAYGQTQGRGRRGKSFYSPDMGGLYMSILLSKESIANADAGLLTVCASVAVCRAIKKSCDIEAGIKWVNDIFYNGKKVCGILCEAVGNPVTHYIVGVGVNIANSEFPEDIKNVAGSIPCDKGTENMLAAYIAKELYSIIEEFDGAEAIKEYRSRLMMLGKEVSFSVNSDQYIGVAYDVNAQGNLIVKCREGDITLSSGEISLGSAAFTENG